MCESATQIIYKHIHDEIPLLPRRMRALQPILDALMAKDRNERVTSAADLVAMVLPLLSLNEYADDATPAVTLISPK